MMVLALAGPRPAWTGEQAGINLVLVRASRLTERPAERRPTAAEGTKSGQKASGWVTRAYLEEIESLEVVVVTDVDVLAAAWSAAVSQ